MSSLSSKTMTPHFPAVRGDSGDVPGRMQRAQARSATNAEHRLSR